MERNPKERQKHSSLVMHTLLFLLSLVNRRCLRKVENQSSDLSCELLCEADTALIKFCKHGTKLFWSKGNVIATKTSHKVQKLFCVINVPGVAKLQELSRFFGVSAKYKTCTQKHFLKRLILHLVRSNDGNRLILKMCSRIFDRKMKDTFPSSFLHCMSPQNRRE